MQPSDLKQRLYDQLALDYCCTPAEAADRENQFHTYVPLEGRRRFEEKPVTFLKVVSFRNKLLFTGDERIVAWCRSMYENDEGSWFMEPGNMRVLDRKLGEYGYCLDKIHPFLCPKMKFLCVRPEIRAEQVRIMILIFVFIKVQRLRHSAVTAVLKMPIPFVRPRRMSSASQLSAEVIFSGWPEQAQTALYSGRLG